MDKNVEEFENFGGRVRQVRKELRVMQKVMAKEIGITPAYLSEIELGRGNPGILFFVNLVRRYNVNPVYLITGEGNMFMRPEVAKVDIEWENLKQLTTLTELNWLLQRSNLFRTNVMGYAAKFHLDNHSIIEKTIEEPSSQE